MAVQPLRNVVLPQNAVTPSTDIQTDLPVNPIKVIYYTLMALQDAASDTTDKQIDILNLLRIVNRLEVLFRGTTIVSGSLTDLMVMNAILTHSCPHVLNRADAATNAVAITVPIYLGRPRGKDTECFPATRRGELTLRRLFDSLPSYITSGSIMELIETVEYLGAVPKSFLKYVTIAKGFTTLGDNDIDFPLGNPILGALLHGDTSFEGLPPVATWDKIKLLVDGVEWTYALTNWVTLNGQLGDHLDRDFAMQHHVHTENLAAAYAQDVATSNPFRDEPLDNEYGYLDFDEFDDDTTVLQTAGRGRCWLRVTSASGDAARMLPLERVDLTTGA
jgi:hypothetical protein